MTKEIVLSNGTVALVDDADYAELSAYRWHQDGNRASRSNGKNRTLKMHRQIMGEQADGREVDHINGNGLDNRRCNLRLCTHAENTRNGSKHRDGLSSTYKGVTNRYGKWQAMIRTNNKGQYLGMFTSPEDAARAYDAKARELFGEFARLNFAEDGNK